jgi:hypothetical protein
LIDGSGSEGTDNFHKLLTFVTSFVETYDINLINGVRVGLVSFDTTPHIQFHLRTYNNKHSLQNAIQNTPYLGGNTNTALAMRTVLEQSFTATAGDRPDARNILFVITYGQSTDASATERAAYDITQANIWTFAIGIGSNINIPELVNMATNPSLALTVPDFDQLHTLHDELVTKTMGSCTRM